MNESYVYLLVDPRNNQPFYVGKGRGRRMHFHAWEARNSNKTTYKLNKIRKIHSLGLDVVVRKVDDKITDEQAKDLECLLIAEFRDLGINLTNATDGGEGTLGFKQSPELINKRMAHRVGKPLSDEHKKKIKESWVLRKSQNLMNPKTKTRIFASNPNCGFQKGYKQSEEHKAKIGASLKGKPKPIVECPHCTTKLSPAMAKRWHFDNCKEKE